MEFPIYRYFLTSNFGNFILRACLKIPSNFLFFLFSFFSRNFRGISFNQLISSPRIVDNFSAMSRFVDFHRVSGKFLSGKFLLVLRYPWYFIKYIRPTCMLSVTFTFRNFHWNQISWKLSSYSRISFRKILRYFFLFLHSLSFRHRISFRKFLTIINYPYLSPVTQSFLKIPGYPVLAIHVFSSDTFERYFLTFFTQVIPIEITYRRIRSIGDSRRSTGGSRPTRWDSVSTMHFSRSPRPLVHTKGIRNCCCYVAPRGGHL